MHAVLSDLGAAQVVTVSRSGRDHYENIARHYDAGLLVNATPVGMFPENYAAALDLSGFTRCACVLDLIYNPAKTRLLLQGASDGNAYTERSLDAWSRRRSVRLSCLCSAGSRMKKSARSIIHSLPRAGVSF